LVVYGCISTRNFQNQRTRVLEKTAYTLARSQAEVGVSALSVNNAELGAYLGGAYGVSNRVMGRINLMHTANGLIGTTWKWNFYQTEKMALAASAGISFLHGSWIWAVPDRIQKTIGDVNAISLPFEILSSFPVAKWLQLNLGLGYSLGRVIGPITFTDSDASVNAGIGVNNLHIDPALHFYIAEYVAILATAEISVWATSPRSVVAEGSVADGVRVGVQSGITKYLPPGRLSRGALSAEVRLGSSTYVRAGVATGGLTNELTGIVVMPFLGLYWRIPP
jgi:hypothetical protein